MEYSIYGFQFSISAKATSDKIIRGDLQVHLHGGVGSDSPLRKKTYMHLSEELATREAIMFIGIILDSLFPSAGELTSGREHRHSLPNSSA